MTTPEEREKFCEENPDNDKCGCQRLIEDYFDHYKEYEKKVNLRDNWWKPELEKYNKAYKNIQEFQPVGKRIYDLHVGRTSLINAGLISGKVGDWVCQKDRKTYICDKYKRQRPNCSDWYPKICRDGGCDWFNYGTDNTIGCDCDGYGKQTLWGCKLNSRGKNNMVKYWEDNVGKKYAGYCDSEFKDQTSDHVKGRNCETYNRIIGTIEEPKQPEAKCCANTIKVSNVHAGGSVDFSDVAQSCQQEISENLTTSMQNPEIEKAVEDTKEDVNEGSTDNVTVEVTQESTKKSSGGGGAIVGIIFLILLIVIIYFLFIRSKK